jgi:hypothetical protein
MAWVKVADCEKYPDFACIDAEFLDVGSVVVPDELVAELRKAEAAVELAAHNIIMNLISQGYLVDRLGIEESAAALGPAWEAMA